MIDAPPKFTARLREASRFDSRFLGFSMALSIIVSTSDSRVPVRDRH
jgi:hypothetical protein